MTLAVDMKTLSKIQKLLALSRDGGANEHEAALALDKAQELMRDNNLSAAMLEAQGVQSDDERRKNRMTGRAMFAWQRTLMEAVAASNYCLCGLVFNRDYDKVTDSAAKGYELIGRLSNVTAAQNMFDYLLQTARRLTVAAAVEEFWFMGCGEPEMGQLLPPRPGRQTVDPAPGPSRRSEESRRGRVARRGDPSRPSRLCAVLEPSRRHPARLAPEGTGRKQRRETRLADRHHCRAAARIATPVGGMVA